MKKGIKEKWNLTSIPNRGIGVEGDFNFEACPNDVLKKKKDEGKKKEEWKKERGGGGGNVEVLSEASRLEERGELRKI